MKNNKIAKITWYILGAILCFIGFSFAVLAFKSLNDTYYSAEKAFIGYVSVLLYAILSIGSIIVSGLSIIIGKISSSNYKIWNNQINNNEID